MHAGPLVTRKPRFLGVLVRALLISFVITLLAFAVSLFLGIVGSLVVGAITHHENLTHAYRDVAFPVAVVAASLGLIAAFVMEFRRYRRRLALWRGF